jgi:hypothetical protein
MKNTSLWMFAGIFFALFIFTGCPMPPPTGPGPAPAVPTELPTPQGTVVLVDDMEDNGNQINTTVPWLTGQQNAGYWYTYDDLAAPNNGDSKVWPMSATADQKYSYNATPVVPFQMSVPGVQESNYCARVSGTVTTTFAYSFVGMGFSLIDAGTNPKIPVNLSGYTKLHFLYKNGPGVRGSNQWKVKMNSDAHSFSDACDVPVKAFTATDTWQSFDQLLTGFTQEGWCSASTCPTGTAKNQCYAAADFIAAVTDFQFQTNGSNPRVVDLLIDDIYLVK